MIIELPLGAATAVFTTRHGGVSPAPFDTLNLGANTHDDAQNVAQNRRIICAQLGLSDLYWQHQVHSIEVDRFEPGSTAGSVDADALITSERGVGLVVTTADCLPVVLASNTEVAVVHCGWRGLAAEIVQHAAAAFRNPPHYAAVGPGIGQPNFEVGEETIAKFGDLHAGELKNSHIDLRAIAERKLRAAGVDEVAHAAFCTYADERFFSHRRSAGLTGRQAGIAWLN